MKDNFANPEFAASALALSEARAGRSGVRGLLEGRKNALAAQDAQRERERLMREAEIKRRQREALEGLLEAEGVDGDARRRAIILSGMNDPATGLLNVQKYDAQQDAVTSERMGNVETGRAYGNLLDPEDPRSAEVARLLNNPATVGEGVALGSELGLLSPQTASTPEVTNEMLKRYTPASIQKYIETGSYAMLDPITEGEDESAGDAERLTAQAEEFTNLMSSPVFESAVGAADQYFSSELNPFVSQEQQTVSRTAEMKAQELVLSAAQDLSGAMSDGDIKLLQSSAPKTGDDEQTWYRWYNETFLPKVNAARKEKKLPPLDRFTPGAGPGPASTRSEGGGRSQPRRGTLAVEGSDEALLEKY